MNASRVSQECIQLGHGPFAIAGDHLKRNEDKSAHRTEGTTHKFATSSHTVLIGQNEMYEKSHEKAEWPGEMQPFDYYQPKEQPKKSKNQNQKSNSNSNSNSTHQLRPTRFQIHTAASNREDDMIYVYQNKTRN
jgi:hypothetical protein